MKRVYLFFLLSVLIVSFVSPAIGVVLPAPEAGSLTITTAEGDSLFTLEAYPEIYLTPNDTEKIIKAESKRNKPIFLHFSPPKDALPVSFGPARAAFSDAEQGLTYYYYVKGRARFNHYINGVKPEFILADGKDDVAAIYLGNQDHRAYALISLPGKEFSELARIDVSIADHTGRRSQEELSKLVLDETARLRIDMHFVELDRYWSDGTYASVQLLAAEDPVQVTVDTTDLIVMGMDSPSSLRYKARTDDGKLREVNVQLSPYSYAYVDHGEKRPSSDYTLADGTRGKIITYKDFSYAGFPVLDAASYGGGPLYLTIEMEASSAANFPVLLEETYARLTFAK